MKYAFHLFSLHFLCVRAVLMNQIENQCIQFVVIVYLAFERNLLKFDLLLQRTLLAYENSYNEMQKEVERPTTYNGPNCNTLHKQKIKTSSICTHIARNA